MQIQKAASATNQHETEMLRLLFGHNRPHFHAETPKRHVVFAGPLCHDGEKFCLQQEDGCTPF